METLLLIGSVICLTGGIVWAFRSATSGVAFTYLGLGALYNSRFIAVSSNEMLFWAIASLLLIFAGFSRLYRSRFPHVWRNYIVGGALVGMVAGCTLGHPGIISGAALGAMLGGVAYTRTAAGSPMRSRLWRALVEVGLPAVVTMSMVGVALFGVMHR